jgi:hypothetical protein
LDRGKAKAGGLDGSGTGPPAVREKPVAPGAGEESRIRSQKCARPTGEAMVASPPSLHKTKAAPDGMREAVARPLRRRGTGPREEGPVPADGDTVRETGASPHRSKGQRKCRSSPRAARKRRPRRPEGCPGLITYLASSAQRRQRYRANSSVSSPVSGLMTVWPIVTQPSLQAWRCSSWWSWSSIDGCAGALDSFTAASLVGCPGSGVLPAPAGPSTLRSHYLKPRPSGQILVKLRYKFIPVYVTVCA